MCRQKLARGGAERGIPAHCFGKSVQVAEENRVTGDFGWSSCAKSAQEYQNKGVRGTARMGGGWLKGGFGAARGGTGGVRRVD